MKKQIQQFEGQELNQEKTSQKIRRDEEELAKIEVKAESYESKYQKALKTLNSMKAIVENTFTALECHKNVPPELLGAHGVTESNIMSYIGAIEQRRDEIFQACREYVDRKRESGEPLDIDPTILEVGESFARKDAQEPAPDKITVKDIEEQYSKIPQNEFEIDADIPSLNEMSTRLEHYLRREAPDSNPPGKNKPTL
jgi:hypothetical protein